jgi:hypothetical protein
MKKLTKAQLETFVEFAYHQHSAESWDKHASNALVRDGDWDEFFRCKRIAEKDAFVAVNIARNELGMTDEQIERCSLLLINWANAHKELAAA